MTCIVLLPFIYVDVSVEGTGNVRPKTERSTIIAPVTEIVDEVYVKEGDAVVKGQPILKFRTDNTDVKINYQRSQQNDFLSQCHDLEFLVKGSCPQTFKSSNREQEYYSMVAQCAQMKTDIRHLKTEWLRNKALYDDKLISEEEYEKYYYQYLDKQNELKTLVENKHATWETDLNNLHQQIRETHSNIEGDVSDKHMLILRAPVSGTVENFSGIYPGIPVQAGTSLAVISPKAPLYVEAFVKPKDIAFIRPNMTAKIQIDALNYNEWGMLEGKVESVSSDYVVDSSNNYLFKVRVRLDKNYLTDDRTHQRGYIKKGMTAVVRFMVTKKSLFDLLYQSMDSWVNPTQYPSKNAK
nr:HlyD family efflux transporter periplasmic adaptor subunit [Hallella mizrahii]